MTFAQRKIKILLVEDEKKLARLMERLLTREGFEVEQAFDGEEAERKALNDQFGLIILDLGSTLACPSDRDWMFCKHSVPALMPCLC